MILEVKCSYVSKGQRLDADSEILNCTVDAEVLKSAVIRSPKRFKLITEI